MQKYVQTFHNEILVFLIVHTINDLTFINTPLFNCEIQHKQFYRRILTTNDSVEFE